MVLFHFSLVNLLLLLFKFSLCEKPIYACWVFVFHQLFAQTFTESNLPIVIINTNGVAMEDDPKIVADMGIVYNGVGAINDVCAPKNHYNDIIGVEYRGQSSQQFPLKSYGLFSSNYFT